MRREVMLLAAICCSLLDRCGADAMRKEGDSMAPGPQNRLRLDRAEVLTAICGN